MKAEGFLLAGYMTVADGVVSEEERALLRAEFDYENLDPSVKQEVYKIIGGEDDSISLDWILEQISNFSYDDKKEILEYCLRLGFSDNEFSQEEQDFFSYVCNAINYPEDDFNSLIDELEKVAEAGRMAQGFGKDATEEDIKNVENKMDGMKKGPLAKIWDKVQALWRGFNSPNTPAYMKAIIIGGLIYMVTPIDLVPDFIPIAGLLDDAGVIGMVFRQFIKVAAIGLTTTTVIKLTTIGEEEILADLEKDKAVYSAKISKIIKDGNYNKVNVGLYDKEGNFLRTKEYESDNINNTIKEGETLIVRQ